MNRPDLFARLRSLKPDGRYTPADVILIDGLADELGLERLVKAALTPSPACAALVKQFEGCRLKAYPDPGSGGVPWTIGWGSTSDELGQPIKPGTVWTQERADERFADDLAEFGQKVAALLVGVPTTQAQFDALVSFAYNLGLASLDSSTLLKRHKEGAYAGAALEFLRWDHAGGKILPGLTKRRAAEAALYRGAA